MGSSITRPLHRSRSVSPRGRRTRNWPVDLQRQAPSSVHRAVPLGGGGAPSRRPAPPAHGRRRGGERARRSPPALRRCSRKRRAERRLSATIRRCGSRAHRFARTATAPRAATRRGNASSCGSARTGRRGGSRARSRGLSSRVGGGEGLPDHGAILDGATSGIAASAGRDEPARRISSRSFRGVRFRSFGDGIRPRITARRGVASAAARIGPTVFARMRGRRPRARPTGRPKPTSRRTR